MTSVSFRSYHRIAVFVLLLVLGGALAATGTAAADGSEFEVELISVDGSVDEDGDLDVEFELENVGDEQSTQTIRLEDSDENVQASQSVTLSAGDSERITLTWTDVPDRPTRSITPTVRTGDDSASTSVTVRWVEFTVRDVTVSQSDVEAETDVSFETTIRNDGTVSGTHNVELVRGGTTIATEQLTLDTAESDTITFTDVTAPDDAGSYTYEVSTDDTTGTQRLTVLQEASFAVSIAETTVDGSAFDLVATVENEGDLADTQPVAFAVDGTEIETRDLSLDGGAQESVTFTYDTGESAFTANASVSTQQPDIAFEQISQAELTAGPQIAAVTPEFVQGGEPLTVTYTVEGPDILTATLTITGPDGEEVDSKNVDHGTDETATVMLPDRSELTEGHHDITLDVEDEFERLDSDTRTSAFQVQTVFDSEEVDFSEEQYRSPAGDFVEVDISTGDLDEAYILIGGGSEPTSQHSENYLDVLHVDGDATFVINTRLVGTDRDSEDVFIPVDGEVTSYAHSIGAASEPAGVFDAVSFQDEHGNQIAGDLAAFRSEMNLHERDRPLQAGRYRLVAGATGTTIKRDTDSADMRQPVARSTLVLSQPELGGVTTYTLPPGAADEVDQFDDSTASVDDIGGLLAAATETDTVASGDRILIELQSTGIYGALMADTAATNPAVNTNANGLGAIPAAEVSALLDRNEGVHIELADGSSSAGHSKLRFSDVDSSDLYILPDDSADQWADSDSIGTDPRIGGLYIVVDTRDAAAFDGRPTPGDELTVEVAYESSAGEQYTYEPSSLRDGGKPAPFSPAVGGTDGGGQFPYLGADDTTTSVTSSFVVEEPRVDYSKTTPDGELLVLAEAGGVITGETNIAPGSRAELRLTPAEGSTVTIEDIEIGADRSFEAVGEFSAFEPGAEVDAAFYSTGRSGADRLLDERSVRVVDDPDNPASFEITDHSESVTVERGERLGDISATITNTGEFPDRQQVAFAVDGELVSEQSTVLDSGESSTLDLHEEFVVLSPGEYSYTVSTDDTRQSGRLVVTDGDGIHTSEDGSATQTTPPEEEPEPDEPTGGLFGAVSPRGRDVALAAAVTGAMHVLGQWV